MNQPTQKEKVITVFTELLNRGITTTLDVKLELRERYPTQYWTQDFISIVITDYVDDSTDIGFVDNGTFREYSLLPAVTPPPLTKYSFVRKLFF